MLTVECGGGLNNSLSADIKQVRGQYVRGWEQMSVSPYTRVLQERGPPRDIKCAGPPTSGVLPTGGNSVLGWQNSHPLEELVLSTGVGRTRFCMRGDMFFKHRGTLCGTWQAARGRISNRFAA